MDKKWFVHSEYDNMLKQIWSRKYNTQTTVSKVRVNDGLWIEESYQWKESKKIQLYKSVHGWWEICPWKEKAYF